MEPAVDDLVVNTIHMRPTVLAELQDADRRAEMPIEQWLTRLLVTGVWMQRLTKREV